MIEILHPSLILVFSALILPLIPQKVRSPWFLLITFIALVCLWKLPEGSFLTVNFLNYKLILLKVDSLSKIFATIFALITFLGGVYAYHIKDPLQQSAALIYSASSIGVTFAGDYITLFIFWELMAAASVILIWSKREKKSMNAGFRYLFVHLFGGSVLLAGIILHITSKNSILIEQLNSQNNIANWLILVGFGLNAAIPPLNAWLPDAYPKATITGAVFLSALTTKTAVYALARVFPGWEVLLLMGTIMTVYGVVYALITNDIRELLAYHIISQVGYMVAGVGLGTSLSINGSTAHAFSHILYKALLFMGAGVVLYATGTSKLNKLGGLARILPVTLVLYLIGGFSISSVPLFNGFISKSITVSAAEKDHNYLAVLIMNLAMIGTFLSTTLKLPYLVWFNKSRPDKDLELKPVPVNMHIGMGLTALTCIIFGIFPSLLYQYLPYEMDYQPFNITHLVETMEILILTFLGFWFFKSLMLPEPLIIIDFDWLYRKPARYYKLIFTEYVLKLFDATDIFMKNFIKDLVQYSENPFITLPIRLSNKGLQSEYDPDRYRVTTNLMISFILLIFLGIFLLNI